MFSHSLPPRGSYASKFTEVLLSYKCKVNKKSPHLDLRKKFRRKMQISKQTLFYTFTFIRLMFK